MAIIESIYAREIIDSRGNPTVEVDLNLSDGSKGRASVPSGASTGSKEAVELRDNDNKRFMGKGVLKAVSNVNNTISKKVTGLDICQAKLDKILIDLDRTENKNNLGANSILAVSLAFARANALSSGKELYQNISWGNISMPTPFINIINGGVHADNELAIQEFMIIPVGIKNFKNKITAASEIFHHLKSILKGAGLSTSVGDEGGFAPQIKDTKQAIELIMKAIENAGYNFSQIKLGLDSAASEFYQDEIYKIDGKSLSSQHLIEFYDDLCQSYPIISLEDPLSEYDTDGWKELTTKLGRSIQIVGDDLFVTNKSILENGISMGLANSILIKPNQIGTLTETIETMKLASNSGYRSVVSHRSGETEDTFISSLAVASGCGQIKAGSMSRTDRVSKYNELLRISESLEN